MQPHWKPQLNAWQRQRRAATNLLQLSPPALALAPQLGSAPLRLHVELAPCAVPGQPVSHQQQRNANSPTPMAVLDRACCSTNNLSFHACSWRHSPHLVGQIRCSS
jgi:hypothetical protein